MCIRDSSVDLFRRWMVQEEWSAVLGVCESNLKADLYQRKIMGAIENFFPVITVRRKNTDPPWINAKVRRLIRRRKAVYCDQGRSKVWRKMRVDINRLIGKRKLKYQKS